MSSPIELQFNGRALKINAPSTIIEAADQLGIYIPRFCYHKKLSVVANCRMCLVEVEGIAKPVPACATQVTPNMHVLTRSQKTRSAQQAVMEFLLINHPLDCPVCDQGGQCELQDLAMEYGRDHAEFNESKRAVSDPALGPLIATQMTRCIQCTRCVRFGTEVAGQMELGAIGRGEHSKITTYIEKSLTSELSGNMVDVCPVGALTSKPFQFKARAWELRSLPSIAPHDCLGSHVYTHVHDNKVMRVVPRENESINQVWLSDRDRYSYLGIMSSHRLTQPMVKVGGEWQATDWSCALKQAACLLNKVLSQCGAEQLGGLITPSATLEEMYLFQKLFRRLGGLHIDHRLREVDTHDQQSLSNPAKPDIALSELDDCEIIMLIGSNVQREQPLLTPRLRHVARGGCIISLNCMDYHFNFEVAHKIVTPPNQIVSEIQTLAHYCDRLFSNSGEALVTDSTHFNIAKRLLSSKKTAILLGAIARNHPHASYIRYWVEHLKKTIGAKVMHLTEGANATGAWIAGAVPHRNDEGALFDEKIGMSAHAMIQAKLKAYLLFNVEPDLDCANPKLAEAAMREADCVISFSPFRSSSLLKSAHVILPIHTFSENAGTFVNVEGCWQSFAPAIPGPAGSKQGCEALKLLAEVLTIDSNDYAYLSSVRDALKLGVSNDVEAPISLYIPNDIEHATLFKHKEQKSVLWRITEWALYSVDSLVRNATVLQQSGACEKTGVYIHPDCAERLSLQSCQLVRLRQNEAVSGYLPVVLDTTVPNYCVWTVGGRLETASLGASFGRVEILIDDSSAF